jgi:hypothetical protein
LSIAVLAAIAIGAAVVAAFGGGPNGVPEYVALPRGLPAARVGAARACVLGGESPTAYAEAASTVVRVDTGPSAMTVLWLPGLNARSCRAALVRTGAGKATSLATDVNDATAVPPLARYSCPMSDNAEAELFFSYGPARPAELVTVVLSGCRWIDDPGRDSRSWTTAFTRDLAQLAPPAWARYFVPA